MHMEGCAHETKDNEDPPSVKKGSKSFCLLILNGSISHSWHIISKQSALLISVIATIAQIHREILLW